MGDALKSIEELITLYPTLGAYSHDIYAVYENGFMAGCEEMNKLIIKIESLEKENKALRGSAEYFNPKGSVE